MRATSQKSPQTSKEEKPAQVLKLGIRRIGSENSKVRALRMVSLRNALAVFIIGDCVRHRKEKKRRAEHVSGVYMFDHCSAL